MVFGGANVEDGEMRSERLSEEVVEVNVNGYCETGTTGKGTVAAVVAGG